MHQITPGISRQSLREDIPPGNVPPPYRRVPGKQYIFRDADPKYVAQDKGAKRCHYRGVGKVGPLNVESTGRCKSLV